MADNDLGNAARDSKSIKKDEALLDDVSQEIKDAVSQIWRSLIFTGIRLEAHTLKCISSDKVKVDGKIDKNISPVDVAKFIITHYFTFVLIHDGSSAKPEGIQVAYEQGDGKIAPFIPIHLDESNKSWLRENGGTHIGTGGRNYAELRFIMLALGIEREEKEKKALRVLSKKQLRKGVGEYGSAERVETMRKNKQRFDLIKADFTASMTALQKEASALMKADLNGLLNITEKQQESAGKTKVKV